MLVFSYSERTTSDERGKHALSPSIEGIAPALQKWPLNEQQRAIVAHKRGPLCVIAGPGAGKTRSLTLLAMNLILCGDAQPSEIVLCTYTEKAAFELQDRLGAYARLTDYTNDLSRMQIGTIHGICQQLIGKYLHRTPLGNDYETLDQFTQRLFIFERLARLCTKDAITAFRRRWGTDWSIAEKLGNVFNTIAEELILDVLWKRYSPQPCPASKQEAFLYHLTYAYARYQRLLVQSNCIDFAHLESCAYKLLQEPDIREKITSDIRYVLVDEYQDTNYIQEQILSLLASGREPKNLCVIGDEDQALYRFRGATVRNILTFSKTFPDSKTIYLTTNYRSHPKIIQAYNEWMASFDWPHEETGSSRTEKTIYAVPDNKYAEYPAVLGIEAVDIVGEAEQFADLVLWLKERKVIGDYSEVALLLHSVRPKISGAFIDALNKKGIQAYCPRARTFFFTCEISLIVGCFARILHYEADDQAAAFDEPSYSEYVVHCRKQLAESCRKLPLFEQYLLAMEREIQALMRDSDRNEQRRLADYFYRLLPVDPFKSLLTNEESRYNLVLFSRLLQTFQRYYHYEHMNSENIRQLREDFLSVFLGFLQKEGVNLDENRENVLCPVHHVPILTIHQAKGLEFPVVVVGRLDTLFPNSREDDYGLSAYYHYSSFESEERIPDIDRRRLYYVALSRARQVLVCSASKKVDPYFASVWQYTKSWPFDNPRLVHIPAYIRTEDHHLPKPRYGFTSHIQTYTTCPRRYQFFYGYRFRPAHAAGLSFGLLVHHTVERIHRFARDGILSVLAEDRMRELFNTAYTFLLCSHMPPLEEDEKERAFRMVCNYVFSNQRELEGIIDTELRFQAERKTYVLVGQIDLVRQGQEGLEIVDFKTTPRQDDPSRLEAYKQQLHLYAHAMERKAGTLPDKLVLYWLGEERKERALMEIPCREQDVQETLHSINAVVERIQEQKFDVVHPPKPEICRACDVRHLCRKERIIP